MNINKATNAKLVGEIKLHTEHDKKLIFNAASTITKSELKDNRGRVYFIVLDDEIHKIGGSQAKGGIQATISPYLGGFAKGMSPRTYCVWNYMFQKLKLGHTINIYFILAPSFEIMIPSMYNNKLKITTADYHDIESDCIQEYIKEENQYPYLNIQESGRHWIDTGLLEGYPGIIETNKITKDDNE